MIKSISISALTDTVKYAVFDVNEDSIVTDFDSLKKTGHVIDESGYMAFFDPEMISEDEIKLIILKNKINEISKELKELEKIRKVI